MDQEYNQLTYSQKGELRRARSGDRHDGSSSYSISSAIAQGIQEAINTKKGTSIATAQSDPQVTFSNEEQSANINSTQSTSSITEQLRNRRRGRGSV